MAFDTLSSRSYITEAFAKELKLKRSSTEQVAVHTFANPDPTNISCHQSAIAIEAISGENIRVEVSIVKNMHANVVRMPIDSNYLESKMKSYFLADPRPESPEENPIDILIGNDFYDCIIQPERVELVPQQIWLKKSLLGWIITGPGVCTTSQISHFAAESGTMAMYAKTSAHGLQSNPLTFESEVPINDKLDIMSNYCEKNDYSKLWSLDSIGITDCPEQSDDEVAVRKFEDTVKFRDNRYQIRFPWKDELPNLPTNESLALGRLRSMCKRYGNGPVMKKVDDIIQKQESDGIIEKINADKETCGVVHYLPHQVVMKDDSSTTKVRLVFDASAKTKSNLSLNDCLLRGPVILQKIPGILTRIRFHKILTVSDIQAAFLQVGIQEIDRDCTRFFWLKDINASMNYENLQVYRFSRVPFGIISSPFLLAQTIHHHLSQTQSESSKQISENLYVDNVFAGFDNEQEAKRFYRDAKEIFQAANMNLRENGLRTRASL